MKPRATSAGLSVLVGIALILIPFCVSSFSAFVEDRGFVLGAQPLQDH